MDRIEFLKLIEEVDATLAKQNVPIHVRPIAAFKDMVRDYDGPLIGYGIDPKDFPEYVGPNLMHKIEDWYRKRYGDKIYMPTTLGRIPVIVRGQLFTARIPLAYGAPGVNALDFADDMTDDMKQSLTSDELKDFVERWCMGYELVYEMEDMLGAGSLSRYNPEAAELIRRAMEDRDNAVNCLRGPQPQQTSLVSTASNMVRK